MSATERVTVVTAVSGARIVIDVVQHHGEPGLTITTGLGYPWTLAEWEHVIAAAEQAHDDATIAATNARAAGANPGPVPREALVILLDLAQERADRAAVSLDEARTALADHDADHTTGVGE